MSKIPITKPYFGSEELDIIQEPLKNGWVVQGPFVKEFEDKFSFFVDAKHSIATSSCTTALHIAVAALGLKPGDEVILPAYTWISTANVIEYMGAKPVFCDIELDTFNIDYRQVESLITEKTAGVIPVHLFGLAANMTPLMDLANRHKLWVVEDAACGFGAYYKGQHCGTFGQFGCFSFHPRKSITTGEGGMITTDDSRLEIECRSLRDHGASQADYDRHHNKAAFLLSDYKRLGFNYRMTDIQGALGSVQMDRASWILGVRKRLAKRYDDGLGKLDWLSTPVVPDGYEHGYQSYVCLFQSEKPNLKNLGRLNKQRNELMTKLEEKGIATRQGTHAVVTQGWYVEKYGFRSEEFPNSRIAEQLSISLPLYVQMTEQEQDFVIQSLLETFGTLY